MNSQYWAMAQEKDYEDLLYTISYETFTIFNDWEPDQSVYFAEVHSSNPISIQIQDPQYTEAIFESSIGTETNLFQSHSQGQSDQTQKSMQAILGESSETSNKKKASKRQDDNNNAHKQFITPLNKVLKNHGLLEAIKKKLKKEGDKFEKGSRYSFIMRLIDARAILAQRNELQRLQKILNEYCHIIANQFKLPDNPTPADHLKFTLIEPYQKATRMFLEGRQIEATQCIYEIEGAKQNKYKIEGIKKIEGYLATKGKLAE